MSRVIARWADENKEADGHYAVFSGFCRNVAEHGGDFAAVFDGIDIYEQLALFDMVCKLLEEEVGQ